MPGLTYGVILFFTLSGFLLHRPFAAAILRGRRLPGVSGDTFRNRALRMLPAHWFILVSVQALLVQGRAGIGSPRVWAVMRLVR
jgi:peptidoglycan/LPS O-acetylase OafA/YrhL